MGLGPVRERARAAAADPGRLTSLGSNNRWQWWNEAVDVWRADPISGAGAGTFELARRRYRESALPVTQPHDVPLQALADGGLVGLALFFGAVAAGIVVASVRAAAAAGRGARGGGRARGAARGLARARTRRLRPRLRRRDARRRSSRSACWPGRGGRASSRGGRSGRSRRSPAPSRALPCSSRPRSRPRRATPRHARSSGATSRLRSTTPTRAESLNPFSLEPLFARARAQWLGGDQAAALASFREAVRRQPDNPDSWEQLGLYLYERHDLCRAYRALNEQYTLDPNGRQWEPGGPLDIARDAGRTRAAAASRRDLATLCC